MGRIAEQAIDHLAAQQDVEVKVTLEIDAALLNGFDEQTLWVVTENSRTLNFDSHGFEGE